MPTTGEIASSSSGIESSSCAGWASSARPIRRQRNSPLLDANIHPSCRARRKQRTRRIAPPFDRASDHRVARRGLLHASKDPVEGGRIDGEDHVLTVRKMNENLIDCVAIELMTGDQGRHVNRNVLRWHERLRASSRMVVADRCENDP
jgi:hypothetical protein